MARVGTVSAWDRVRSYLRRLFGGRPQVPLITVSHGPSGSPGAQYAAPRESFALLDGTTMRALVAGNPWAMAAIREIAREIASRDVVAAIRGPDGKPVVLGDDHPLAWFIANRVRGYTRQQYVERQIVNLLVLGECYGEVYGRPSAVLPQVASLIPHDPEDVSPLVTGDETMVDSFRVTLPVGGRYPVDPSRMVFAAMSPVLGGADRFRGLSPLYPLIPEMKGYQRDQEYQRDQPRGSVGSIKIAANKSAVEMGSAVEQMNIIRERAGVWVQPKDYTIEGLPPPKDNEHANARQAAVKRAIMVALGIAPVKWDESVTNDSASIVQQQAERRMRMALSSLLWRQHEPLARMLARPGEMDAGLHLRSDWSGEMESEEQAAESDRLDLEAKRAAVVKTYTDAGIPLADAMRMAGIEPEQEAPDGQDRDSDAGAARSRLRAV